jgi:hypothetical protein
VQGIRRVGWAFRKAGRDVCGCVLSIENWASEFLLMSKGCRKVNNRDNANQNSPDCFII